MRLITNTRYNKLTTVSKVPLEGDLGGFLSSIPKVPLRGIRGLFVLLAATSVSFAQQANYTLTQPDNVSKTYVARDYIQVRPGYSFNSADGKTLKLRIDKHLVVPASYQSSAQQPNPNRTLNTSYAVGTIAGGASVTPTGAATYQIPIEVMPGTGGMQPNVSISYNSQSGNGLLGYGWNLGAVSAITRTGKTIYHDGSVEAPDLTTVDNLTLDGQRLMKASGTNLAANSTYKTEIETYQTITCKTLGSNLAFEVKNKEGWVMEYGSSTDSYVKPKDGTTAYAWLLKKVTDANGNYMTYTYTNNSTTGESFLKQIDYTGNASAGLTPYNKIEFFYEARNDKSKSYIAGKAIEQTVILKKITCSAYDEIIREYQFNYFYDGFLSKLTEVVEFGQNGVRYNSTVVEWGDIKYGNENLAPLSVNKEGTFPVYADFNEDGRTDFISYSNNPTASSVATLFLAVENYPMGVYFSKQCTIPLITGFAGLLPADLNGDGLMDIVRIHKVTATEYQYYYSIFNGTSFSNPTYWFKSASLEVFVGDFTGDGKHGILTKSEQQLYKYGSTTITTTGIVWGTLTYNTTPIRPSRGERSRAVSYCDATVIDFNGNGKTDLLVMRSNGFDVYELNGSSFTLVNSGSDILSSSVNEHLLGDFNGDGKTDILVKRISLYHILFSTGTGFEKKILPNLGISGQWFAGDFNKDGKTDIVSTARKDGYGFPLEIGWFTGEAFQFEPYNSTFITSANMNMIDSWKYLHFSDFDGDGYPELCFSRFADVCIVKTFNSRERLFVKTIVNGLNQKTSFEYNPITDASYCRTTASIYTFPASTFQQPLYVVTRMKQEQGNIVDDEYFYYKGARSHKQGKGFLGFEEVQVINATQDREVTTKYGYNATYYNVYPTQQKVTTMSGSPISQTDITNSLYTVSPAKVIFPYVSKTLTTDNLTGLSKTITYSYNSTNHGNPDLITETQGSLKTQTVCVWGVTNSSYKNRLTQQTITQSGIGQTFIELKRFEYDAKARLIKKTDFGNTKPVITTYGNYDNFGNPRTITTSATGLPDVETKSTFDATGRFPVTNTDALGKTSQATYNNKTGAVLTQTDIAGQKITYQYNDFGQRTQTITPTGTTSYNLAWDISGNNLYRSTVISPIAGTHTTWYNAAGLETKKQMPGFSGNIITENEYNTKGQLTKSYLPDYGTKSTQYVAYTYDTYGRLLSENNINRTTSYNYNGLTTTVTAPNGTQRKTTLNTSGLVATSTDEDGNMVTYTYNSLGKPVSINAAGSATSITYDNRGFQTELHDPNLENSIQYEYDAYGQLKKHTNARGHLTSYEYDAAGRITQEIGRERTLDYLYATSGGGVGQIQKIMQGSTEIRAYTYNNWGQPLTLKERIDATDYTTTYTYNTKGQILTKTSPSGLKVSYGYNVNGMLTSLKNAANSAPIWTLNAMNALGQITQSTQGNELIRTVDYDATYHLPTQIALKDGTYFTDRVKYTFDALTGNLLTRIDFTNALPESFEYDNLNRLTKIGSEAISYANNGNITDKFNVGEYQYSNGKPHAVSEITNPTPSYEPSGLEIVNTSYNRVSHLLQFDAAVVKEMNLFYNPDKQRNKTMYYENGSLKTTTYYAGNYEKILKPLGVTEEYDYIYTPEGLSAIAKKTNGGTPVLYYVNTDHLGSIRTITKADKTVQTRYTYDAWGVQTLHDGTSIINRGYTGHEHLPEFGLINMNARMYDPVLGRFLETDPYVQMPSYTQGFNRYSYALNNPLKYTDPSGEFILAFIKSIGDAIWHWDISKMDPTKPGTAVNNSYRIWKGYLTTDKFWKQLPQNTLGFLFSHTSNIAGQVTKVESSNGATVLTGHYWGQGQNAAITLGSFINGGRGLKADPHNSLFQHEYGHYLQSKDMGWGYLTRVGIPSIFSAGKDDYNHDFQPFEQDANRRAFNYFNANVEGFYKSQDDQTEYGNTKGWNFRNNPLDVYHVGKDSRGVYYDYRNSSSMALVNSLTLQAKPRDYVGWIMMLVPEIGIPYTLSVGFYNNHYYQKYRVK